MKIRQQLLLITAGAILLPLAAVMLVVRTEMRDRLTSQHETRVSSLIQAVSGQLEREQIRLSAGAATLLGSLETDNEFRLGLSEGATGSEYVRGYGQRVAAAAGLDVFQVQDQEGRLITSGHFSMDFGRIDRRFLELGPAESPLLIELRSAEGPFIALVRVQPFSLFGEPYRLTVGIRAGHAFLNRMAPDSIMAVGLIHDGALLAGRSIGGLTRDIPFRYLGLDASTPSQASIRVAHGLQDIQAVIDSLDRWLLVAFAVVAAASLVMAWYVANRFTRPITELAEATALIELERTGSRTFARRRDEIGQLSRTLESMVRRLRITAGSLREAERRATLGDFARQANHDIKNGLTPIRNVFRHLSEVSSEADELKTVFEERETTITSGIDYLDRLATAYALLSIRSEPEPLEVSEVVRSVGNAFSSTDHRVTVGRTVSARVLADSLALRRVLENLVSNARDSLPPDSGKVILSMELQPGAVELIVSDSGAGIPASIRDNLFEDFFTTKEKGTGLGLSIVRRLVMDMNGSIRVESEPGNGASFIIRLPLLDQT